MIMYYTHYIGIMGNIIFSVVFSKSKRIFPATLLSHPSPCESTAELVFDGKVPPVD